MSIFEEVIDAVTGSTPVFNDGDPMDVFHGLEVFVEFDSDAPTRRPITERVPGHPGAWVCAYSSLDRLRERRSEDVEYSGMRGERLLACLPDDAGLWYDRGYSGGRKILLPPVRVEPIR